MVGMLLPFYAVYIRKVVLYNKIYTIVLIIVYL